MEPGSAFKPTDPRRIDRRLLQRGTIVSRQPGSSGGARHADGRRTCTGKAMVCPRSRRRSRRIGVHPSLPVLEIGPASEVVEEDRRQYVLDLVGELGNSAASGIVMGSRKGPKMNIIGHGIDLVDIT